MTRTNQSVTGVVLPPLVNTRDEQRCDKYLGEKLQGFWHKEQRCKEKVRPHASGQVLVLRVGPLSSVGRHSAGRAGGPDLGYGPGNGDLDRNIP